MAPPSTACDPGSATPLVTSGLPNGCTFVCSLNGTAATLSGDFTVTVNHTNVPTASPSCLLRLHRPHHRSAVGQLGLRQQLRLRLDGPDRSQQLHCLVGSTPKPRMVSVSLIQVGATLMEEAEVRFDSSQPLVRTVSGAAVASSPSTNEPAISYLLNSVTIPNAVVVGPCSPMPTQPAQRHPGQPPLRPELHPADKPILHHRDVPHLCQYDRDRRSRRDLRHHVPRLEPEPDLRV